MNDRPVTPWRAPLFLLALTLALAPAAWAQRDTTRVVLPDIAPREVEIRGTLEINFPALQRQPLVGFNPPPRVPAVPPGRLPFIEAYSDAGMPLPESPLRRPEPPSVLRTAPPAQGDVEMLAGRYYSRGARAYVTTPVSARTALLWRLRYDGADGHRPDTAAARARFDALRAGVAVATTGDRLGGGVALDGFLTGYDLYGARPDALLDAQVLPVPERDGAGITATAHLRTISNTRVDGRIELRAGTARFDTRAFEDDEVSLQEQRFGGAGHVQAPLGRALVWAEADGTTATLADDLGRTSAVGAGAGLQLRAGRMARLRLGARFVAALSDTRALIDPAADPVEIGYLAPDVRLDVWLAPGVEVFARQQPGVAANGLDELFRDAPYLLARPELRPSLHSIDAEGGLRFYAGPVQVEGRGGYRESPQLLFFEDVGAAESGGFEEGFVALRYGEAEVLHGGGSVSVVLPAGLHARLGGTYRETRLPDRDDADIPYVAPFTGEATLSYRFAESRGLVQLTGHYESRRFRDLPNTREVGAFADVDAEVVYEITRIVGLMARIENLGGDANARWGGYPISPMVIGIGARIHW